MGTPAPGVTLRKAGQKAASPAPAKTEGRHLRLVPTHIEDAAERVAATVMLARRDPWALRYATESRRASVGRQAGSTSHCH